MLNQFHLARNSALRLKLSGHRCSEEQATNRRVRSNGGLRHMLLLCSRRDNSSRGKDPKRRAHNYDRKRN